jgi:hypothetical protein
MTDAPSRTHADVGLPEVVSPAEWRASFEAMLTREKALTAARDEMSAARRRMPMMRVDTGYRFVGPAGEVGLLELFEGRRQLIVYRFFYAPDVEGWPEGACSGCSMFADSITHPAHLNARDTTLAFVSAVPQERIETYCDRWDGACLGTRWSAMTSPVTSMSRSTSASMCSSGTTTRFPHILRQRAWCRDNRIPVHVPRPHAARPPGALGGLPGGSPAGRPVRLVATTRRVRLDVMAGSAVRGDRRHHLRPAEPHETKELEELQDRSASHWDHPDGHFDWAGVTTSGRSQPC